MIYAFRNFRSLCSCYSSVYVVWVISKLLRTPSCSVMRCRKVSMYYTTAANIRLTLSNPLVQKYLEKLKTEYEEFKFKNCELANRNSNKRLNYLTQLIEIQQQISDVRSSQKILNDLTPARLLEDFVQEVVEGKQVDACFISDANTAEKEIGRLLRKSIDFAGCEDKELVSAAEEERAGYKERLLALEAELLRALVPEEPAEDCCQVVLEVSAGVGGQEAMLFARELFHMYCAYADYKGWEVQVADLEQSDLGGLRHASLLVQGDQVYQHLRHEAGVHRVQRVPTTEKSGRMHTSTVTVATLPQPAEVDVCLKVKDLQIDTKRASGAGGQHVNTTDSAVRVTHLLTGVVVECQVDRSQIKNRELALQMLRAKLYQLQLDRQAAEITATRKQQVGSSLRSEKIRTYNFNQDRVTDHRVGSTLHDLRGFMSGSVALDCLIRNLDNAEKANRLQHIIAK